MNTSIAEHPATWAEAGAKNAWQIANRKVRELLTLHQPDYIAPQIDATFAINQIRSNFNIRLR